MADLVQMNALPASDERLVVRMAADAGVSVEAMRREILRAYLGLVRGAPEALPNDPLRRLSYQMMQKGGGCA